MGVEELTQNDARVPTILTGSSRARRSAQVDATSINCGSQRLNRTRADSLKTQKC